MAEEKQEIVAEQVEVQPPAPEVDLASLQTKLTKLETELEQTKKGLSTAHQTLTQKDRELKSQADLRAEIQGIREDMELLAVGFATRDEVEPTDGTSRQNVLAELQKRRLAAEGKRKQEIDALARQETATIISGFQKRVEALGLTDEDDDYGDIYRLVRTLDPVDIKTAERRLKKLEVAKVVVKGEKESEEALRERIFKEEMEKRYPGMYTSDIGAPSGTQIPTGQAMDAYVRGEITAVEAKKKGVVFS